MPVADGDDVDDGALVEVAEVVGVTGLDDIDGVTAAVLDCVDVVVAADVGVLVLLRVVACANSVSTRATSPTAPQALRHILGCATTGLMWRAARRLFWWRKQLTSESRNIQLDMSS